MCLDDEGVTFLFYAQFHARYVFTFISYYNRLFVDV
jgi:hypothetical protein